jgi:hypothetical protein
MANRAFFPRLNSLVENLTFIQGSFSVGSSGAVSALKGNGVTSVTHQQTGVYGIVLDDQYNKLMDAVVDIIETSDTAATIASGLTAAAVYVITTVGDASAADWLKVGVPAGVTPAVGLAFAAAATGSGNATTARVGAVIATSTANSLTFGLVGGSPDLALSKMNSGGSSVFFTCRLASTGALADPVSGSRILFSLSLRNSNVKGKGE